ncbi:MAG: FlgD immunoglobulin-like domain containing protein, partial [Patescibacteria group bacterium]
LTHKPDTFQPEIQHAVIEFKNSKDTNITVEIQNPANNDIVRTFSGYQDDNYSENTPHSIAWNGKDSSNNYVSLSTYKAVVVTKNDYGVVVSEKNIIVNNSGGSISESNAHISGISFSPSSTFEPATDDELRIQFDAEVNLDSLKVHAVRGSTKIELFNETDIEEENNLEINWNGQDDDDEYVAKGSWKIQFESKVGSTTLLAAKSITVDYEKPVIDDLYISKNKFDPDKGEFIYVVFRVDLASEVTLKVLEGNDEQDNLVEDMEVEADKWYAVLWDGENYNYDDDIDIKLIAQNVANHDVFDSKKISVDLAEDKVSGSKSNITQDYIEPVLTDGNASMTIYYNLEDTADLTVTIHKGESGSGSKVIQLAAIDEQESGSHSISWDGKDSNGKKLSSGIYSYKIVSGTNSGTDTETGLFFVGTVGDTEGGSGSSSGSSNVSGGGSTSPNVIVDGGSADVSDNEPPADDSGKN